MIRSIYVLVFTIFACTSASGPTAIDDGNSHSVLFIGNSLTYTNDLPAMVRMIGTIADESIQTTTIAGPNLALIDHTNGATNSIGVIRQGGWDFVVLQQGPTSTGPGPDRDTLILATQLIDREVQRINGRTALFMVWPPRDRLPFIDNVRSAYRDAALSVDAAFYPAGEAWRRAWSTDATLPLYGSDNFHPSRLGTFAAALEIFEQITGRDVRELPAQQMAAQFGFTDRTVVLLARAAHDVNSEFGIR